MRLNNTVGRFGAVKLWLPATTSGTEHNDKLAKAAKLPQLVWIGFKAPR